MSVSAEYRDYIIERLACVRPVRARAMFGGVGLYAGDVFFGLLDDDNLYFNVDHTNRADFEAAGSAPFRPFGTDAHVMQYYEVPGDVLEDDGTLSLWMGKAIAVALAAKRSHPPRTKRRKELPAKRVR